MKVKSIKPITLDTPLPVYDLTVTKYHNFQLANGAIVHNSHIQCLLLAHFYKHMRPLVERGHVYIGLPPLYRVTEKGRHTYLRDEAALAEFFRKRAGAVVGEDEALLALAAQASVVQAGIEAVAGSQGVSAADVAHALRALLSFDDNRSDQTMAFAEAVVALREKDCEGVVAEEVADGVVVVSGLEPSGRYFTTIIGPEFLAAVQSAYDVLADAVGEEHALSLLQTQRTVSGQPCGDVLALCAVILKESRRGIALQRNKGLGEMQAEELGETTLDPATRRLIRVEVADFDEAGEFLGNMMSGGAVEARREVVRAAKLSREQVDA